MAADSCLAYDQAMRLALGTTALATAIAASLAAGGPAGAIVRGAGGVNGGAQAAAAATDPAARFKGLLHRLSSSTGAPTVVRPRRRRRIFEQRSPAGVLWPAATEGSPPTHGRWGRHRASRALSAPSPSSPTGGRRRWPMQPICSPARCRASSAPRPVSPARQSSRQACGHGYGLPLLGCRRSADAVWRPVAAQSSSR